MPSCRATFFDGVTATPRSIHIVWSDGQNALQLFDADGRPLASWPLNQIRSQKDLNQGGAVLRLSAEEAPERISIGTLDWDDLARLCKLHASNDISAKQKRRVGIWAVFALGSVAAMVFAIVPALAVALAAFISPEREAGIGRMVERQVEFLLNGSSDGEWICRDAAGQAAFDKMLRALAPENTQGYDLRVQVVDVDELNAFALPGGQLTFFDGLIQNATTQEQIAGVLAHEIAHVIERHPMESVLRAAGSAGVISLLFGDATGGTVAAIVAQQLVNASHSRLAETQADDFAIHAMKRVSVNPAGLADFFDSLTDEYGDAAAADGWASSHPPTQKRAETARSAFNPNETYVDILTSAEWAALKNMCN